MKLEDIIYAINGNNIELVYDDEKGIVRNLLGMKCIDETTAYELIFDGYLSTLSISEEINDYLNYDVIKIIPLENKLRIFLNRIDIDDIQF